MRPITMMQAQYKPKTEHGEVLTFENCKGGYFSTLENFALKVTGKTYQVGSPTVDNPIPIPCVKSGTEISCGNTITVPTDLYEGDIWFPLTGKVIRNSILVTVRKDSQNNSIWELGSNGEDWQGIGILSSRLGIEHTHKYIYSNYFETTDTVESKNKIYTNNSSVDIRFGVPTSIVPNRSAAEFADWVEQKYASGNPMQILLSLVNPVTEQYQPQPIFAPKGTATLTQIPLDLPANFWATMLIAR